MCTNEYLVSFCVRILCDRTRGLRPPVWMERSVSKDWKDLESVDASKDGGTQIIVRMSWNSADTLTLSRPPMLPAQSASKDSLCWHGCEAIWALLRHLNTHLYSRLSKKPWPDITRAGDLPPFTPPNLSPKSGFTWFHAEKNTNDKSDFPPETKASSRWMLRLMFWFWYGHPGVTHEICLLSMTFALTSIDWPRDAWAWNLHSYFSVTSKPNPCRTRLVPPSLAATDGDTLTNPSRISNVSSPISRILTFTLPSFRYRRKIASCLYAWSHVKLHRSDELLMKTASVSGLDIWCHSNLHVYAWFSWKPKPLIVTISPVLRIVFGEVAEEFRYW